MNCLPCEDGYTCFDKGISELTIKYECPVGNYCPSGFNIRPIACREGTYLDKLGSMDLDFSNYNETAYITHNDTIWE